MQDLEDPISQAPRREPWSKGKLTGAKPPLRPKHVWSIRSDTCGGPPREAFRRYRKLERLV